MKSLRGGLVRFPTPRLAPVAAALALSLVPAAFADTRGPNAEPFPAAPRDATLHLMLDLATKKGRCPGSLRVLHSKFTASGTTYVRTRVGLEGVVADLVGNLRTTSLSARGVSFQGAAERAFATCTTREATLALPHFPRIDIDAGLLNITHGGGDDDSGASLFAHSILPGDAGVEAVFSRTSEPEFGVHERPRVSEIDELVSLPAADAATARLALEKALGAYLALGNKGAVTIETMEQRGEIVSLAGSVRHHDVEFMPWGEFKETYDETSRFDARFDFREFHRTLLCTSIPANVVIGLSQELRGAVGSSSHVCASLAPMGGALTGIPQADAR